MGDASLKLSIKITADPKQAVKGFANLKSSLTKTGDNIKKTQAEIADLAKKLAEHFLNLFRSYSPPLAA